MDVVDLKNKLIEGSLGGRQDQAGSHGFINSLTGLMLSVTSSEILPGKEEELLSQYGCASLDELKEAMTALKEEFRTQLSPEDFQNYFRDRSASDGDAVSRR